MPLLSDDDFFGKSDADSGEWAAQESKRVLSDDEFFGDAPTTAVSAPAPAKAREMRAYEPNLFEKAKDFLGITERRAPALKARADIERVATRANTTPREFAKSVGGNQGLYAPSDATPIDLAEDMSAAVPYMGWEAGLKSLIAGADPLAIAKDAGLLEQQQKNTKEFSAYGGSGASYPLGLNSRDLASGVQSLPFSVYSMMAYAVGAAPGALFKSPVASHAGGAAISAPVAYRMDAANVLTQVHSAANAEFKKNVGRDMAPEEFAEFASQPEIASEVRKHALAEAGFEALGNFITSKAFGKVLSPIMGKATGDIVGTATKEAGRFAVAKAGAKSIAGELATETPTHLTQSQAEIELGIQNGKSPSFTSGGDWVDSFKDVFWPTVTTMGLMTGAAKAVSVPANMVANKRMAGRVQEFVQKGGHQAVSDDELQNLHQNAMATAKARPKDAGVASAVSDIEAEMALRATPTQQQEATSQTASESDDIEAAIQGAQPTPKPKPNQTHKLKAPVDTAGKASGIVDRDTGEIVPLGAGADAGLVQDPVSGEMVPPDQARKPGVIGDPLGLKTNPTASVPVMITKKMGNRLLDLGYTAAEIRKLTPQQAHDLIGAGISKPRATLPSAETPPSNTTPHATESAPQEPTQAHPEGLLSPMGKDASTAQASVTATPEPAQAQIERSLFTPTHEASDGTPVIPAEGQPGVWVDATGMEIEDQYATPISKHKPGRIQNEKSLQPQVEAAPKNELATDRINAPVHPLQGEATQQDKQPVTPSQNTDVYNPPENQDKKFTIRQHGKKSVVIEGVTKEDLATVQQRLKDAGVTQKGAHYPKSNVLHLDRKHETGIRQALETTNEINDSAAVSNPPETARAGITPPIKMAEGDVARGKADTQGSVPGSRAGASNSAAELVGGDSLKSGKLEGQAQDMEITADTTPDTTSRDKIARRYSDAVAQKTGTPAPDSPQQITYDFADAIINKDGYALEYLANGLNDVGKSVFSEVTGVKLPKQQGKTWEAIRDWAGITPEQDATRRADALDKQTQEGVKANLKSLEMSAAQLKMPDGLNGKEWVEKVVAEGYDKLTSHKTGAKTDYWLANTDGTGYHLTKKGSGNGPLWKYAKAYLDQRGIEKTDAESKPEAKEPAQESLADLNSGRAFANRIQGKIAEWVSAGTSNGTRPMDRNWEAKAVKRFIDLEIKAQLSGQQIGTRAAAKIAVAKSETFAELNAAIEKYVIKEPAQDDVTKASSKHGDEAGSLLNDRDHFTLERVNNEADGLEAITFSRGERIKIAGSFPMRSGEIAGISQAERKFRIDGSDVWYDFGYAYKHAYNEAAYPREFVEKAIEHLESRLNEGNAIDANDLLRDIIKQAKHFGLTQHDDDVSRLRRKIVAVERSNEELSTQENTQKESEYKKRQESGQDQREATDTIRMTMEEWKATHRDFKARLPDGTRSVIRNGAMHTVEIVKERQQEPDVEKAKEALQAAGVTGKELREAIKDVRKGDLTADEVVASVMPAAKIEDFGEKIGGAKKDVYALYKDKLKQAEGEDIAAVPLSKSWPEPDYQSLLDDGVDPWAVGFARAARDEIPVKPKVNWKLKQWARQAEMLRDIAINLMNGEMAIAHAQKKLIEMAKTSHGLNDVASRIDLYREVGHSKSLKGVRLSAGEYSLYKGVEYKPSKVLWTVSKDSKAAPFSNWPTELAIGDTKEEAIQAFKDKFASMEIDKPAKREVSFSIYSKIGENAFYIGKKVGRNYIDLEKFESIKEARAYMQDHHDELAAKLEKVKELPAVRRDTNNPRAGEDMRGGQDVTPELFAETFGFRGVEFGNWVDAKKRQKDLNESFDALMDMAAVLEVPAKALSLNGELGLAFGARGSGGVDPAKAHYERGHVVINLTKKDGAGSLGHEWWHALDNYFSRTRSKRGEMMTEAQDVARSSTHGNYTHIGEVRKEMIDAFGLIVKSVNQTALKARSGKLDSRRSKDYWTTKPEMTARSFETYLIAKLHDQNASNDYLANIVAEETWKAAESLGWELDSSYPYPTAAEIPAIRASFDHFFNTVQTKETAKGVALYAIRSNAPQWYYSQMQQVLEKKLPNSGGVGDLRLMIANLAKKGEFKQEELEWSGLIEWLQEQKGKISKQQVLEFLKSGDIQVRETERGGASVVSAKEKYAYEKFEYEFIFGRDEEWLPWASPIDLEEKSAAWDAPAHIAWKSLGKTRDQYIEAEDGDIGAAYTKFSYDFAGLRYDQILSQGDLEKLKVDAWDQSRLYYLARVNDHAVVEYAGTAYDEHTIPGGENYRELLLTLPEKPSPDKGPEGWGSSAGGTHDSVNYRGSHFDEPNILAHVRFNERTDAEGKRVLFLEEVQSDWHQEGRKSGYKGAVSYLARDKAKQFDISMDEKYGGKKEARNNMTDDELDYRNSLYKLAIIEEESASFVGQERKPPDAPFKTTWPMLAMKRMIRHAAENGFDRIAWTTGEQQAERYDLSKQVEAIQVTESGRNPDEVHVMVRRIGGREFERLGDTSAVHRDKLDEFIGKDAAQKALDLLEGGAPVATLEGVDLKVGGEGMKGFYDQILPAAVNKYVKKWGAKVGETTFFHSLDEKGRDFDAHAIDITDAMRESAMAGQPLFAGKKLTASQRLTHPGMAPTKGTVAGVRQVIASTVLSWGQNAPDIQVVQSIQDLPAHLRPERSVSLFGVHDPSSGAVYLIADNLGRTVDVRTILAHEAIGHYAMEEMLGDALMADAVKRVQWLKDAGDKAILAVADEVARDYGRLDSTTESKEIIAKLAERRELKSKFAKLYESIMSAVRKFLRKIGFNVMFSNKDIDAILADAERWIKQDGSKRTQRDEALWHRQLGEIDLVMGDGGAYGASRWVAAHPEVGADIGQLVANADLIKETSTQATLKNGTVTFDLIKRGERWRLTDAKVGANYAIRKTADGKPDRYALNPDNDSLLQSIAKRGGISAAEAERVGIPKGVGGRSGVFGKPFVRAKGGLPFDDIVRHLVKSGYIPKGTADAHALVLDKITKELQGEKSYTKQGAIAAGNRKRMGQKSADPKSAQQFMDELAMAVPTRESLTTRIKQSIGGKLADMNKEGEWLRFMTRQHLAEWGERWLPHLRTFENLARDMDAARNERVVEAAEIAKPMGKWARKHQTDYKAMSALAHEATIEGVDPSEPFKLIIGKAEGKQKIKTLKEQAKLSPGEAYKYVNQINEITAQMHADVRREAAYPGLVTKWNALTPEAQRYYTRVRDAYSKRLLETEAALAGIADRAVISDNERRAMKTKIREHFESMRVQGPYFPLSRPGDYWVEATMGDPESVDYKRVVLPFEKHAEMKQAVKKLKLAGWEVRQGEKIQKVKALGGASEAFVDDVISLLDGKVGQAVRDDIYQLWLTTMPELSMRKHFIHRNKVEGYDDDMIRAFADNMFHGAYQIAKMEYADRLADLLKKMDDAVETSENPIKAGRYFAEIQKRYEWLLNPQAAAWTSYANSLGFTYFLGLSIAAAMVNAMQTPLIAFPVLGNKFGFAKAAKELGKANNDFFRGGHKKGAKDNIKEGMFSLENKLTGQELDYFQRFQRAGGIDKTMTHDLIGQAESISTIYTGTAAKVQAVIGYGFHHVERYNREITFLAAFRMGMQKHSNPERAYAEAADLTWKSHYDYSNANKARFMQGNIARVAFMFRQYSLNTTMLLVRSTRDMLKGESKEVRKEGAKQLAGILVMTQLAAGALGLPWIWDIMELAFNAFQEFFGDGDDDPEELQTVFLNFLSDHLPETAVKALGFGFGNAAGVDLHSRVGLNNLWLREGGGESLDGGELFMYKAAQLTLGPLGGIGANVAEGVSLINDGKMYLGIEKMMPKAFRDAIKAYRYYDEGVTNRRGDTIVNDIHPGEISLQAMGFTPGDIAFRYEANRALNKRIHGVLDRRQHLMDRYLQAQSAGDQSAIDEWGDAINTFNEKNPENGITERNLRQSQQGRDRRTGSAVNGIYYNRNSQHFQDDVRFGGE